MKDEELGAPADQAARAELSRVLGLLADRIRTQPLSRLERTRPGEERSPADHVRAAAQELADLAADAEGEPRRPLPHLALHGIGDQFAVVGADVARHGDAAALATAHEVVRRVRGQL